MSAWKDWVGLREAILSFFADVLSPYQTTKFKTRPNWKDSQKTKQMKLKKLNYVSENIVKKGENAGYHHFLLFPQCF